MARLGEELLSGANSFSDIQIIENLTIFMSVKLSLSRLSETHFPCETLLDGCRGFLFSLIAFRDLTLNR